MLEKAKVVMLPTEKAQHCILKHVNGQTAYAREYFTRAYLASTNRSAYHLYLVTDEEIKEGDYCVDDLSGLYGPFEKGDVLVNPKKIVATTNPELWKWDSAKENVFGENNLKLPKIGLDFVEAFVREEGKIEEVMLEYFEMESEPGTFKPKARSNGTVIIHPVKERMYTEADILLFASYVTGLSKESVKDYYNQWIIKRE